MENQYGKAQSHPHRDEAHNEIDKCSESNNRANNEIAVATDEADGGTIAESSAEPSTEQTSIDYSKPLLTHDQLQRELSYRTAMSVLEKLRDAGMITAKEFVIIAPKLEKRFSPVWGNLYQYIA